MANTKSKTKSSAKRGTQARTRKSSAKARVKSNAMANGSLLEEYFIDGLKDIYWAEKALIKALPRMSKAATSKELKKPLTNILR